MTTEDDLTRRLAQLMGWRIYTEENGEYDGWQRRHADSCFIDLDGRVWVYGRPDPWRPLDAIGDAKQIIDRLGTLGWEYMLGSCQDGHYAQFSNYERRPGRPWPEWYSEVAPTLERAICLAALQVSAGLHALAGEGDT